MPIARWPSRWQRQCPVAAPGARARPFGTGSPPRRATLPLASVRMVRGADVRTAAAPHCVRIAPLAEAGVPSYRFGGRSHPRIAGAVGGVPRGPPPYNDSHQGARTRSPVMDAQQPGDQQEPAASVDPTELQASRRRMLRRSRGVLADHRRRKRQERRRAERALAEQAAAPVPSRSSHRTGESARRRDPVAAVDAASHHRSDGSRRRRSHRSSAALRPHRATR